LRDAVAVDPQSPDRVVGIGIGADVQRASLLDRNGTS